MFPATSRTDLARERNRPLSLFPPISYTAVRGLEEQSKHRNIQTEEEVSSPSLGITALPRYDRTRTPNGMGFTIPFPAKLYHGRTRSSNRTPILNSEALLKDIELQPGWAGLSMKQFTGHRPIAVKHRIEDSHGRGSCQPWHSRKCSWLLAALVPIVLITIILGAVLGTFVRRNQSAHHPSVTEIPAGTLPTSVPTTTILTPPGASVAPRPETQLASVAVTGWSVPGEQGYHSLWLFWQNRDGYLSRATYNSSTGNWTRVTNFVEARKKTPLGAAAVNLNYYTNQEVYAFPPGQFQASVVYLDSRNYLQEWTFSDSGPQFGQAGSLDKQKDIAHGDTQLGFYWPEVIYQGLSGEIRTAYFECHRKDQCWQDRVLDTSAASNGTTFVTVPTGNNLSSTGLVYERDDGQFGYHTEDNNQKGQLGQDEVFSKLIPPNATVASFSTIRSKAPQSQELNTYLLWQDANGTIQVSWKDSDDGWQGPVTHPAFAGAETGTALTCLTGLTFPGFPLQAGTELSRCYFQTGWALREVSFNGESWAIVGIVPVDF